jgi:hypothetical protein
MAYTKTNWEDTPSTATPISAANLNNIEEGVEDAHDHIAATSAVHGITNTANIVYTGDSRLTDTRTPTDGSVTTAKIADGAVTAQKISPGAGAQTFNAQTGTTYTLVAADANFGKFVTLNNASSISVTIPNDTSVDFAVGAVVNFLQFGAGQVTVSPASGVTLVSEGSRFKTKDQYAVASVMKTSENNWIMFGNVSA